MRISDWSSDVCSSDLLLADLAEDHPEDETRHGIAGPPHEETRDAGDEHHQHVDHQAATGIGADHGHDHDARREMDERDAQQMHDRLGLYPPQTENADIGEEHAGEDDPDQIGAVDENKRRSEEHTSELQSLMRTSYAV